VVVGGGTDVVTGTVVDVVGGGTDVVVVAGTVVDVVDVEVVVDVDVVVPGGTVVEVVDVEVVVGTVVDVEVVVDGSVVLVVVVDGTVVLVVDVVLVVVLVVVVVVAGVVPVPDRGTPWGVPGALSAMSRLAVRVPVALGENVTDTVQLDADAIVAPVHVSADLVKSAAFAPDRVTLLTISGAVPVFWTVTVCAALVVPVSWEANVRLVGLSVTCGAPDARPLTVTLCGP
jgi:hypothetical protein